MSCIGEFTKDGQNYRGTIQTLELNIGVYMQHNHGDKGQDMPNFTVFASNGAQIGSARIKTSKQAGRDYIRLSLDDPSFTRPIHANLIEKDGKHLLMHSRGMGRDQAHQKSPDKGPDMERA